MTAVDLVWTGVGLLGQLMFSMRFIYQWFRSEQVKRSVVPEAFWYFSFFGGVTLLAYAIRQQDPVFVLGQACGLLIYCRNITLIWAEKRRIAVGVEGAATP
ncbi:MAG: lipid A biosynthesis protein [Azospirillum sp.]|nr:lipid A biosynthesis protein [Azospirillum sp.]